MVAIICIIQNLSSPKGQQLNGRAASFDLSVQPRPCLPDDRLLVTIDGIKGPQLGIKLENLRMLEDGCYEDLAVAVGRKDLRSTTFMATVVDQKRGKRINAQNLTSTEYKSESTRGGEGTGGGGENALRSRGTLIALVDYFRNQRLPSGDIVFHLTDLNLALLLNSYAYAAAKDMTNVDIAKTLDSNSVQHTLAKQVGEYIIQNCGRNNKNRNRLILFKYSPFRIHRCDRPAKEIMDTVLNSNFHIYPCPCETYMDALEVRFLLPGRSTHDFFLDFGEDETIQYARNILSMGQEENTNTDVERLMPEVLVDVDPQMFWSSVLHSKALVKVLKKLPQSSNITDTSTLLKEWSNIYGCYLKSIITFKKVCFSPSEAVRMLPDPSGKWNLINDEIHYNIAFRNAKLAILLGTTEWEVAERKKNNGSDKDAPKPRRRCQRIELRENYKGSEIDKIVFEFTKAASSSDFQDMEIAMHNMMLWNNTKTCDYCGKERNKMFDCASCKGAGYCNVKCQKAAWPTHKKSCKDLRKTMHDRSNDQNPLIKQKIYNPKNSKIYDSKVRLFSEACGVGFLRILWCPSMQSTGVSKNAVTFKSMKNDTIFKTEVNSMQGGILGTKDLPKLLKDAEDAKCFNNNLSNIDPIMRLCLSCGPIQDLKLAKETLDDAVLHAQGSVANLKMKWVGFTPLEWAAKKGHLDIVKWLTSDPRTASLINIGTPVGWACYTDRVDIARHLVKLGASPEKTTETLWNHRPPLLAAAENGKLNAVKFLVEECGLSITVKWNGHGIKDHVKMSPNWEEMADHSAVMKYAKVMLKRARK